MSVYVSKNFFRNATDSTVSPGHWDNPDNLCNFCLSDWPTQPPPHSGSMRTDQTSLREEQSPTTFLLYTFFFKTPHPLYHATHTPAILPPTLTPQTPPSCPLLHTTSTATFHNPSPRLPPALSHLPSAHEKAEDRDWTRCGNKERGAALLPKLPPTSLAVEVGERAFVLFRLRVLVKGQNLKLQRQKDHVGGFLRALTQARILSRFRVGGRFQTCRARLSQNGMWSTFACCFLWTRSSYTLDNHNDTKQRPSPVTTTIRSDQIRSDQKRRCVLSRIQLVMKECVRQNQGPGLTKSSVKPRSRTPGNLCASQDTVGRTESPRLELWRLPPG